MKKLAILYTTTTGNTEYAATILHGHLKAHADLVDVRSIPLESIPAHECLVFCVSTWGRSEMQDDWETLAPRMKTLDLKGKKVAILGLGDQKNYPDAFADGMKPMADLLRAQGATLCGRTSTEGYGFSHSRAVENGRFLGCVVDEESQGGLSAERLEAWATQLRKEFSLT